MYPVFHVIRGVAAAAGRQRMAAQSSNPERVKAMAWRERCSDALWIANLRDAP
jgi:cob(I)alamin adenosyltransferase